MTSPDRESQEPKLKIGDVPKPCYLSEASDTSVVSDGTPIKWIGMEAFDLDGQLNKFLWWRNFRAGDLNNEKFRHDVVALVARLKLETGACAAIGLPVNLYESSPETGFVKTIDELDLVGVYIELDKRPRFNFRTVWRGVRLEAELRRIYPTLFDEVFRKAEAVLPRPKKEELSTNR